MGRKYMKKYLITGCTGFIGSNFVYYMLKKYDDILLVNLYKLTYAGNLENLKGVEVDPRHVFVKGGIVKEFEFHSGYGGVQRRDRERKNNRIGPQSGV